MENPPNQFTEAAENAPNLGPFPFSACDRNTLLRKNHRKPANNNDN
jgi:hypothetical protein